LLAALERGTERLLTSAVAPSPAAGQAALFLLAVMLVTGVYLFFFYAVGWPDAYRSMARLADDNLFGALARGVHRYGADLVVAAAVWHLLRTWILSRHQTRYGRAWLTGGGLFLFFGAQAATGYILPLDIRGQAILDTLVTTFPFADRFVAAFADDASVSSSAQVYLLALHLIPPLGAVALLALHLTKGQRPRLLPTPILMAALVAGLIGAAAAVPVVSLPQADFTRLPGAFPFDWGLLAPVALLAAWPTGGVIGGILSLAAVAAIPYLAPKRRPAVATVDADRCVGCRLCGDDCPKKAITLLPRPPAEKHPWLAVVDESLCEACALCVGSCGFDAISLPDRTTTAIRADRKNVAGDVVVYGCVNACGSYRPDADDVAYVPVLCAGQIHAGWVADDYAAGAVGVVVARCSELRCTGRDGASFAPLRLSHARRPWLPKRAAVGPIALVDATPGDPTPIDEAVASLVADHEPTTVLNRLRRFGAPSSIKRLFGAGVVAAALALFVLGAARLWEATPHALTDATTPYVALRVESFNAVRATVESGDALLADRRFVPPGPMAPALGYLRIPLSLNASRLMVTVTPDGRPATAATAVGPFPPGGVVLFKYDGAADRLVVLGRSVVR
jgi:menaquinol-cytochrome c reductase cytochrome b subunit